MRRHVHNSRKKWASAPGERSRLRAEAARNQPRLAAGYGCEVCQFGLVGNKQLSVPGETIGPVAGNPTATLPAQLRMEHANQPLAAVDTEILQFFGPKRHQPWQIAVPSVLTTSGGMITGCAWVAGWR